MSHIDNTGNTTPKLPTLPEIVQNRTGADTSLAGANPVPVAGPPAQLTPTPCTATPILPSAPPPTTPTRLLSTRQLNAIPLILAGHTDDQVAEAIGVRRQAINRWRNHHPLFIAELNRQRTLLHADTLHRYDQTLNRALTYIQEYQSYYDNDLEDQKDLALQILRLSGRRTLTPATTTPPLPTDPDEIALQLLSQGQDLSPDDSPADDAPPPPPKKSRK